MTWESFVKNDWTDWAEKRGLKLSWQWITPYRKGGPRRIAFGGERRDLGFLPSAWTEWEKERWLRSSTLLTIMEHKKFFRGERPDWAKTFPERKIRQDEISVQQKRFSFQVNFNTVMPWCHWVEREVLLSSHPNQEVLIERLNDAASICRRVTIISTSLDGQGGYARIEDKKDRGSWKVTLWESSLSKLEHRSCEELLNFPGLLSDYVVQWVAQS